MNSDRVAIAAAPLTRAVIDTVMAARLSQFATLALPADQVLFLGDSITHEGLWSEWFPTLPTLNRGVGGDTVAKVAGRLHTAVNAPRAISLLVGTNDLSGLGHSRAVEDIAGQVEGLVATLRGLAPAAPLLLNGVTPRTAWMAPRILDLNARYRAIAARSGASFVDLWPVLAGPDGGLRRDLTRDNLHLNGPGYRAWVEVLRPHLEPLGG